CARLQHHAGRRVGRGAPLGRFHSGQAKGAYPARDRPPWRAGRGGRGMTDELSYEKALEKLDEKLKQLEDGDLSLEGAMKAGGEARVYLKICTERLEAARHQIEVRPEE